MIMIHECENCEHFNDPLNSDWDWCGLDHGEHGFPPSEKIPKWCPLKKKGKK